MKSTTKKILSVMIGALTGLVSVGLITGILVYLYWVRWSYSPIQDRNDFLLIYSFAAASIVIIWLIHILVKRRSRFFAYGLLVCMAIPLFVGISNIDSVISYLNPESFSETKWKSNRDKPIDMVHSLIRDDKIIAGKSRSETLIILGSDTVPQFTDDTTLMYHIDIARNTYFGVKFNKEGQASELYYTFLD